MKRIDTRLLERFERKTRLGYPLGEVHQDLLELGYSEVEAGIFMTVLAQRMGEKVAHREVRLHATAALLLIACGIVLFLFGARMGLLFVLGGAIWWMVDAFTKTKGPELQSFEEPPVLREPGSGPDPSAPKRGA